jgi:hypothetical protein
MIEFDVKAVVDKLTQDWLKAASFATFKQTVLKHQPV